ncbi:MAG: hypothetical protein ACJ75S_08670 [Solirubrobacterales bacterium]
MSDGSTPLMGMRVAADGTITYDFDGHIMAEGLDLLAYKSTEPDDRKVRWLRESDLSKALGWITTEDPPEEGGIGPRLRILTRPASGIPKKGGSELEVRSGLAEGSGAVQAVAKSEAGTQGTATLITDTGLSIFLKLVELANVAIDFGIATTTYPGGTAISESLSVTHKLGRTPIAVVALCKTTDVARTPSYGKASFSLVTRDWEGALQGAGTTATVAWIAIG